MEVSSSIFAMKIVILKSGILEMCSRQTYFMDCVEQGRFIWIFSFHLKRFFLWKECGATSWRMRKAIDWGTTHTYFHCSTIIMNEIWIPSRIIKFCRWLKCLGDCEFDRNCGPYSQHEFCSINRFWSVSRPSIRDVYTLFFRGVNHSWQKCFLDTYPLLKRVDF